VIPRQWPESRVSPNSRRRRHGLPAPFGWSIGIFPLERRGNSHASETFRQIAVMLAPHVSEMRRQPRLHTGGEHRSTILLPFTPPDHDLTAVEIEVFDAQFERLLKSKPSPIEQCHDDPRDSSQLVQDGTDLVDAEYHRHAHRTVCMGHVIDGSGINPKNPPIQEQQHAERLVLRRRAHLPLHGEVGEIPTDLVTTHLRRMPLAMKDNESPNPHDVGFFGAAAIATNAHCLAHTYRATLVRVVSRTPGRRKRRRSGLNSSDDDAIVEGRFANAWPGENARRKNAMDGTRRMPQSEIPVVEVHNHATVATRLVECRDVPIAGGGRVERPLTCVKAFRELTISRVAIDN
jgi:hypothetical protein